MYYQQADTSVRAGGVILERTINVLPGQHIHVKNRHCIGVDAARRRFHDTDWASATPGTSGTTPTTAAAEPSGKPSHFRRRQKSRCLAARTTSLPFPMRTPARLPSLQIGH